MKSHGRRIGEGKKAKLPAAPQRGVGNAANGSSCPTAPELRAPGVRKAAGVAWSMTGVWGVLWPAAPHCLGGVSLRGDRDGEAQAANSEVRWLNHGPLSVSHRGADFGQSCHPKAVGKKWNQTLLWKQKSKLKLIARGKEQHWNCSSRTYPSAGLMALSVSGKKKKKKPPPIKPQTNQ